MYDFSSSFTVEWRIETNRSGGCGAAKLGSWYRNRLGVSVNGLAN